MTKFERLLYILIFFLMVLLGKIPFQCSRRLGFAFGSLAHFLDRRRRIIALDNLQYAYESKVTMDFCEDIVKRVYGNLGQFIFEVGWLMGNDFKEVNRRIKILGRQNLLEAFSKGKGVLFISGHIGAWEILSYVIAKIGMKLNIVYRPLDFKPLDKFMMEFRSMFGSRLIVAKGATQEICRVLDRGETVGLLIDQSADWYNGVWIDFFNHRTCTNKGPAQIALINQVPVVPVFAIRSKDGFEVCFKKEVSNSCTNDLTKDIEINTLKYSKVMEAEIRKHPDQWFWVHRRWKNKAYVTWPKSEG